MLLIRCPNCDEARPEVEFRHAGEAHIARASEPVSQTDAQWAAFLYLRSNTRGQHAERWLHAHGCGRYFNVLRDTVSDRIEATYKAGAPRPNDPASPRKAGA